MLKDITQKFGLLTVEEGPTVWRVPVLSRSLFCLLILDGDGSFLLQYNLHSKRFLFGFDNQSLSEQTYISQPRETTHRAQPAYRQYQLHNGIFARGLLVLPRLSCTQKCSKKILFRRIRSIINLIFDLIVVATRVQQSVAAAVTTTSQVRLASSSAPNGSINGVGNCLSDFGKCFTRRAIELRNFFGFAGLSFLRFFGCCGGC
jgi:hypothetical protein